MGELFIYKVKGVACGIVRAKDEDDAIIKVKNTYAADSESVEIEEIPTYTDVIPMQV